MRAANRVHSGYISYSVSLSCSEIAGNFGEAGGDRSRDHKVKASQLQSPTDKCNLMANSKPGWKSYNGVMALETLTLEQLLETRQSTKNQLSRVSGIQAEAVKDTLSAIEDMIRIRQDERRLQHTKV